MQYHIKGKISMNIKKFVDACIRFTIKQYRLVFAQEQRIKEAGKTEFRPHWLRGAKLQWCCSFT